MVGALAAVGHRRLGGPLVIRRRRYTGPVNPRPLRLISLVLVVSVFLAACTGKANAPTDAATVNGHAISNDDVQADIPVFEFLASINQNTCGGVADSTEQAARAACARVVLAALIQGEVVRQYARDQDIEASSTDMTDETLAAIEQQLGGGDAYTKALADGNVTDAELRSFVDNLALFEAVGQAVGGEQVDDAQLKADYKRNKAQFTQLHVQHILVKDKAQAEKILGQATAANFATLATKYSTDPSAAENGGEIQSSADQLVEPFVQAVLAAKPGEIIGPVQTQFGYHVIRVISVESTPFDQAKEQLLSLRAGPIFQEWLAQQLQEAKVTVNPRYGTFDPKTGQITAITSTSASATPSESGPATPAGNGPATPAGEPNPTTPPSP